MVDDSSIVVIRHLAPARLYGCWKWNSDGEGAPSSHHLKLSRTCFAMFKRLQGEPDLSGFCNFPFLANLSFALSSRALTCD